MQYTIKNFYFMSEEKKLQEWEQIKVIEADYLCIEMELIQFGT